MKLETYSVQVHSRYDKIHKLFLSKEIKRKKKLMTHRTATLVFFPDRGSLENLAICMIWKFEDDLEMHDLQDDIRRDIKERSVIYYSR